VKNNKVSNNLAPTSFHVQFGWQGIVFKKGTDQPLGYWTRCSWPFAVKKIAVVNMSRTIEQDFFT
jgi:hypothetical protein